MLLLLSPASFGSDDDVRGLDDPTPVVVVVAPKDAAAVAAAADGSFAVVVVVWTTPLLIFKRYVQFLLRHSLGCHKIARKIRTMYKYGCVCRNAAVVMYGVVNRHACFPCLLGLRSTLVFGHGKRPGIKGADYKR